MSAHNYALRVQLVIILKCCLGNVHMYFKSTVRTNGHTSSFGAGSPARADVERGACAVVGRAASLSLFHALFLRVSLPLSLWEKPVQGESSGGGGGLFFFPRSDGGGSVFGDVILIQLQTPSTSSSTSPLLPPLLPPPQRQRGRIPQGRMCVRKRGGYRPPDLFNAKIVSI